MNFVVKLVRQLQINIFSEEYKPVVSTEDGTESYASGTNVHDVQSQWLFEQSG